MFEMPMLPRTLQAAYRDLTDKRPKIRVEAVRDLVRAVTDQDRSAAGERLVKMLSDSEPEVLKATLLGLADLGFLPSKPRVLAFLCHADLEVRALALLALGELGASEPRETMEHIRPFLGAREPRVRFQALTACKRLTPAEALPRLLESVTDADPEIADLALRLLEEGLAEGRYSATDGLREAFEKAQSSGPAANRALAERLSLELGARASTPNLELLLRGTIRARELADLSEAIEVVGRHRLEMLAPALETRAFGWLGWSFDPFRFLARAALAALGHGRARASVDRTLRRGTFLERAAMVSSLGRVLAREYAPQIAAAASADPRLEELAREALARLDDPSLSQTFR